MDDHVGLATFTEEFHRWVSAYNRTKGTSVDPIEIYSRLAARMPDDILEAIGTGLEDRWLVTEPDAGRGYFVRESDHPGPRGGQFTLISRGEGQVDPCWELFVQLADYARLRAVAEPLGYTVRMEDALMDITVYAGNQMLMYVENKTHARQAKDLLRGMQAHLDRGIDINTAPTRGDDSLRKCHYMLRSGAHPRYFGLSAPGYWQLFEVTYHESKDGFVLMERDHDLTWAITASPQPVEGTPPPRDIINDLATQLSEALPGLVSIVRGTGQSAYNVYIAGHEKAALGVYLDGRIWSYMASRGNDFALSLSVALARIGIDADPTKDHCFWRREGTTLTVASADLDALVLVIREIFVPPAAHREPTTTEHAPSGPVVGTVGDDPFSYFEALHKYLLKRLPPPEVAMAELEAVMTRPGQDGPRSLSSKFPEGAFMAHFILPCIYEFLRDVQGLSHDQATHAFLSESYREWPQYVSGSPTRQGTVPFTKAMPGNGTSAKATGHRACPDMALRSPAAFPALIEAKLLRHGTTATARAGLIGGVRELEFYMSLPPLPVTRTHPEWNYPYGILLAYDGTPENEMSNAWTEFAHDVKAAFWDDKSIYVMILPGITPPRDRL